MSNDSSSEVIQLSSVKFLIGCAAVAVGLFWIGQSNPWPAWLVAAEVFATILGLFVFGSIRYQLDKNALTYGAVMVIIATTTGIWWPESALRADVLARGAQAWGEFAAHHFFSLHGLERIIHIDTMLFILGLTFFVAVIAQTRLLETVSGVILQKMRGRVLPTVALLALLVAASSGVLDGVSMIGLMIRTLVIILLLGKATRDGIIFAVIVSTVITTVSGMWLAYGEPPNLIMKTNLFPHLDNAFFLRYCLPMAIGSYVIVVWNLKQRLAGKQINLARQDVLDAHNADIRFLQADRHGEVLTPMEALERSESELGAKFKPAFQRILKGETLGLALVHEQIPAPLRRDILGHFTSEEIAPALDEHYLRLLQNPDADPHESARSVRDTIRRTAAKRLHAQRIGALAFIPFMGLLVAHAVNHEIPLFLASFAGFFGAFFGIAWRPKVRRLALTEGVHEYKEYLFLFPLFLSITLLQKTGFFDQLAGLLQQGIDAWGVSHIAYLQYWAACFLSAILDNNVVADFASKALHGLDLGTLHLFSMAQIAGYAVGGCWTHIGCAQSVVAFAFIRKEVDPAYTPLQWIKAMTRVILQLSAFVTVVVYVEGALRGWLR